MRLRFRLLQSDAQISKLMLDVMVDELNKAVTKASPQMQSRIRDRIVRAIQSSTTYISLSRGALQLDFGIARPQDVLDGLINIWKQELSVSFSRFRSSGNQIVGSFEINAIDSTFAQVTSSPYASYFSNSNVVDWLYWLLTKGTASIIKGYDVYYKASPMSRTGSALMRPSMKSFSVNPAYAGTVTDNFVTEAIIKAENDFMTIMQEEIEKAL